MSKSKSKRMRKRLVKARNGREEEESGSHMKSDVKT
jgi:hypothetical protein